jgi:hypothetical protein
MKVLDITEVKIQGVDLSNLKQHAWTPYEVPVGTIGVTTIIKYIARKLGKFDKETALEYPDQMSLRVLVGMGWETMCAQLYPDMWWQPSVCVLDGICGHPDGFGNVYVPEPEFCVDEFKYTAKSIRVPGGKEDQYKSITDEWMWNCQMMSYIRLAPAFEVMDRYFGRFHVNWAMGNYTRYTLDERYLRYLVEYERREIEQNWAMLVNHRDATLRSII